MPATGTLETRNTDLRKEEPDSAISADTEALWHALRLGYNAG